MNIDTVFLQTLGKFIQLQVQFSTAPLLQKIDSQDKIIIELLEFNRKRNEEFDGAISGIASEIARVEKLIADLPKPENGKDGKDGTDCDWDMINEQLSEGVMMIRGELKKYVDELPRPKDGSNGKDCDMDVIKQRVDEVLLIMPTPKDGKDAEVDWDKVTQIINTKVKELPPPKDGRDGKDGADIVGAVIDRGGSLVVTLSNGITRELGRVVGLDGHDGAPGPAGKDGRDGFSLDDFDVIQINERTIEFIFKDKKNDTAKAKRFVFPVLIDRGVWRQGDYLQGDVVTFGGSMFIAQCDTSLKPETKDWRLAVKKGVNGSNGAEGPQGKQGPPGKDGRDLTQLGQDGKKWG